MGYIPKPGPLYWAYEQAGDPANIANTGIIYTKDVAGVTELFYEDNAGAVTQITGGGSLTHSLQQAYDDGQVIDLTAAEMNITTLNASGFDFSIDRDGTDVLRADVSADTLILQNGIVTVTISDLVLSSTTQLQFGAPTEYITDDGANNIVIFGSDAVHIQPNGGDYDFAAASLDMNSADLSGVGTEIGAAAGLTIYGGGVGSDMNIHSTHHATKGNIVFDQLLNVTMTLGDVAGVNKLSILDNSPAEIFQVNSNGVLTTSGSILPTTTSAQQIGGATSVWQDLYVELVRFYDPTEAEAGHIHRTLTEFIIEPSGAGGDANAVVLLGDAAGATSFKVQDSAPADVFTVDSDGNTIVAGDLSVASGSKINIEGSAGDSYFIYNGGKVELWVDGVKEAEWG